MKTLTGKYLVALVVVGLIVIRYSLGFNVAMLSFILFWQIMAIKGIIKGIGFLIKTQKKHVTVRGAVIDTKEVFYGADNDRLYEVVIEFSFPDGSNKFQIIHTTQFQPKHEYSVWVNEQNPQKSTIDDQLQSNVLNIIPLILIALFLFYIDYLYLEKILKGEIN
jgi:hypothetical protein